MNRFSKMFLVVGLIIFGLTGLAGCAGEVNDSSENNQEQVTEVEQGDGSGKETGTGTNTGTGTGAETGTGTEPGTSTGTETGTCTEPGTSTGTETGTGTESGTSTETETGTGAEAGSGTGTDTGTGTETETVIDSETEPENGTGTENDSEPELYIPDEIDVDFTQSYIAPSPYTYPEKVEAGSHSHPVYSADPAHQFPLIKIVSTENGGTNYFVTEPVAHHVKDVQHGWSDPSAIPDPWYEKCTIGVDDAKPMDGQVKVRGNWTTSYDKKSLRIKFDKKQNLCGLHGGEKFKNWVLLAVWKDSSFLRDAVGLKMFKSMFPDSYYASDFKLVELEVNGEYMGVYLLAEQQEVKPGRIDITETDKSTGTDIGYFIEFDQYYNYEVENERFEINYGNNIKDYGGNDLYDLQKGYTIKSDINTAEQKEFIMKYMNRLWRLCYEAVYNKKYYKFSNSLTLVEYTPEGETDDEKCKNCISSVIDVTSLANTYIFNELVCDPDLYLTSFLMDIDFGQGKDHKLRFEAPWDFDSTMGNKSHCADAQGMYAGMKQRNVNFNEGSDHYANPWMVIFIRQGWFQQLVKEQWSAIDKAGVQSTLTSFIDTYSSSTYEDVFNYTRSKWGSSASNNELCDASKAAAATSQKASAEYLKDWLTKRFASVDVVINGLEPLNETE